MDLFSFSNEKHSRERATTMMWHQQNYFTRDPKFGAGLKHQEDPEFNTVFHFSIEDGDSTFCALIREFVSKFKFEICSNSRIELHL